MPKHEDFQKIWRSHIEQYGEKRGSDYYYRLMNKYGCDDEISMAANHKKGQCRIGSKEAVASLVSNLEGINELMNTAKGLLTKAFMGDIVAKPFHPDFRESFEWVGDVSVYGLPTRQLIKVKAIHPMVAYHPDSWASLRHYLLPELEGSAASFVGRPTYIDHRFKIPPPYKILDSRWHDGYIEQLLYAPPYIVNLIENGIIKHVSVNFDWKVLERMNGVAPRGLRGIETSYLVSLKPGDPTTTVELFEALGKLLLKEASEHGTKTFLREYQAEFLDTLRPSSDLERNQ